MSNNKHNKNGVWNVGENATENCYQNSKKKMGEGLPKNKICLINTIPLPIYEGLKPVETA